MKVVLELQDQPSNIKKVTVRHDIVIGRGAECNLRLSAPQVSRRHCFLRIGGDSATITDLDSSNGTFLNGKKITSGKRYQLPDGCQLAVGPVTFTARVLSEITAGELLEVRVTDDRIEAEEATLPARPFDDSSAEPDLDATVADLLPEPDDDSMNFAIESGGDAAQEDDPTADYVPADSLSDGDYFTSLSDDESGQLDADPANAAADSGGLPLVVDESATEAGVDNGVSVSDALVVDEIIESDSIEVIEVIKDVDIIDDEDVVLSDDDEVIVVEEESLMPAEYQTDDTISVDDEDLLILDEDPKPADAETQASADEESSDSVEDDLRNFLQGLD